MVLPVVRSGNDLAPVVSMRRSGPARFLFPASTVGLLVIACLLPASAHGQAASGTPRHPPAGLALQVALDRAGFSPGIIDGAPGRTTRAALQRFQEAKGPDGIGHAGRRDAAGIACRPAARGLHPDPRGSGWAVPGSHSGRHDGKAHTRGACLHLTGRDARGALSHHDPPAGATESRARVEGRDHACRCPTSNPSWCLRRPRRAR